jgi:antibiotic biosynthesis monooxygenase (ABM) superfamily enzyme
MTVVVTRSVKPGREQDFEAWLTGTIEALTRYPGYQGANIVRPDTHTIRQTKTQAGPKVQAHLVTEH